MAADAIKAQAKGKGKKDPAKEAAEKKAKEEKKLAEIEETFFAHVAEGDEDLDMIKARGNAAMMEADPGATGSSIKI